MKNKLTVTVAVLFVCVAPILALKIFALKESKGLDKRTLARSKGDSHAPVWITEYFDYQCPACRTAHDTLDKYFQKYPKQLYLQVRFFPLPAHKYGLKTALYAECAARQNKFWKFHDLVFENQTSWSALPDAEPVFKDYARLAGMDLKKCEACLKDPETEKAVMEEKGKASALGVQITPTAYVNGKIFAGAQAINAELQNDLDEKNSPPANGR